MPRDLTMTRRSDPALIATELRVVIGRLLRRLRADYGLPLHHGAVLGRLDREGSQSVSDLASAEHVRPQSMAQTVKEMEACGLVARHADPCDRRRAVVEMTERGIATLHGERRRRDGWLAAAIAQDLSRDERAILAQALEILDRLAASE